MSRTTDRIKQLVRIEDYAAYLGYHVKKRGSYHTLLEHDSVVINTETNRFFRNSSTEEHAKGSVIDFAMHFGNMERGMGYREALADLERFIGSEFYSRAPVITPRRKPAKKELVLPPHGGSRKHVYAYLSKIRGIDSFIIDYFFASNHLYEDEYHNCVFVSYDEKSGRPDFACRRGTLSDIPFKGDIQGSNYDYCFRLPCKNSRTLYVGEAVIDIMSLMTWMLKNGKEKKEIASCHYQALASTQKYMAIFHYLDLHPEIEKVFLAMDNDRAGREVVNQIIKTGKEKNYRQAFIPFLPEEDGMDWNEKITRKEDV